MVTTDLRDRRTEWRGTIHGRPACWCYATGRFGKNHFGDRDEHLPTNHGFDEFFGNLYHPNAEEEHEPPDYPDVPGLREKHGPRGVIRPFATPDGGQKIDDTRPLAKKRMETVDDEMRRNHRSTWSLGMLHARRSGGARLENLAFARIRE